MTSERIRSVLLSCCRVDLLRWTVDRPDQQLVLSNREADLLGYLAERPGSVIPREELLERVFDFAPGVNSRAIDTTMQRLRAKVESDPAHPDHLLTDRGAGYHFVALHDPGTTTAPQQSPVDPNNTCRPSLPPETTRFVGRTQEVESVRGLLAGGRILTLHGTGGIGKTRLALRAARAAVERDGWAGGAWFCSLERTETSEGLLEVLSTAVGASAAGGGPEDGPLLHRLRDLGPAVLVLDNCEHLVEPLRARFGAWLGELPELAILATSRVPLRLGAEQILEVEPMSQDDAAALLAARAKDRGARGTLDPEVLQRLAEALDRLPLAIELAAGRVALLGLDGLERRLDQPLRVLRGGFADLPERHRTAEAAIEGSWNLLDEAEQRLLLRLSVMPGGFTMATGEILAEGLPTDAWGLDLLRALHDRSLLQTTVDADGDTSLYLLNIVRAWAQNRLDADERASAERVHADHVLSAAWPQREALVTRGDRAARGWLEGAVDDLRAIVDRFEASEPELAAKALLCADLGLEAAAPPSARLSLLARCEAFTGRAQLAPLVHEARLRRAGVLRRIDLPTGLALAEEAAKDAAERGDERGLALAEVVLAQILGTAGRNAESLELAQRGLAEAERLGDPVGTRLGLMHGTYRILRYGPPGLGHELLKRGTRLAERTGDAQLAGHMASYRAVEATDRGDFEAAEAHARRSLELRAGLGRPRETAASHIRLATIAIHQGRWNDGAHHAARSQTLYEAAGEPARAAIAALFAAYAEIALDRTDAAGQRLDEAVSRAKAAGAGLYAVQLHTAKALLEAITGEPDNALAALGSIDSTAGLRFQFTAAVAAASVAMAGGGQGTEWRERAWSIEASHLPADLRSLHCLEAIVAHRSGDADRAAESMAAAEACACFDVESGAVLEATRFIVEGSTAPIDVLLQHPGARALHARVFIAMARSARS